MSKIPSGPNLQNADFWQIGYAITGFFTAGTPGVSPVAATLRLLTDRLGWNVGAFWIVNELQMALECAEFYAQPGPAINFGTVTRARKFSIGEGLPGSVWRKREFIYIPDVCKAENFPRAWVAESENLHSGMAFAVHVGKTMYGVIEFFSHEVQEVAPSIREFLVALGGQIGVFLERLSAGEALEAAKAELLLVAEAASLAIFTIDEQSNIVFANAGVQKIFGYDPQELIGAKLTTVMPEYLRRVHEQGFARYIATGKRHVDWNGVHLPGLHKNGSEILLEVSFGEFRRAGKRVFTGFARLRQPS
ncbi:MAG: hypothetical protein QOD84_2618 [Acidobacteriaceae bacterium]|jgi:PAS domain S-box-containing protein